VPKFFKNLFLEKRLFVALSILIGLFILSLIFQHLFILTKVLFYFLLVFLAVDSFLLFFSKGHIYANREVPEKLSNGDQNELEIQVKNHYSFSANITIIDEIPFQFQKRDFKLTSKLKPKQAKAYKYQLRPTERGIYSFGKINIFVQSPIGFISKRYTFNNNYEVAVYPSFLQLRKYMLLAFTNRLFDYGLKKIRRIGHTMEFEQIKDYVQGDDLRTINWKATAKRGQMMVNQYQDEKSQPIYSIIDRGRVMKMPFKELSLLDYAINASLVISNIAIKKQDKAGILTFSNKIENRVVPDRRSNQMNLILESLYKVSTDFVESDFSHLYYDIKRNVKQRGLLMLYTNFETMDGLKRQLPFLQSIAKQHLLVVIFFENTELSSFIQKPAHSAQEIFDQTIAEKFIYEKKLIVNELNKYGIQTILTKPENLTIDTINKYLEIKARGLI